MSGAGWRFRPDDAVRVVRVLVSEREVTGSSATPPQPRVGDVGTVVADVGDGLYLVESCTDDGMTIWMTELAAEELELVDRTGGGF
jgi:hypothetical protein